jgi:hypothetical protein
MRNLINKIVYVTAVLLASAITVPVVIFGLFVVGEIIMRLTP